MPTEPYQAVAAALERYWADQSSVEFEAALSLLRSLAEETHLEACEYLAEILATSPIHRDISGAYKWYHIALSQQGYGVEFKDLNHSPPHYSGPDGDFRNEAQVSELIAELGFGRARELDREAATWLRAKNLTTGLTRP